MNNRLSHHEFEEMHVFELPAVVRELPDETAEAIKALRNEVRALNAELGKLQPVSEDYKALISIIERAKKLSLLRQEEEEDRPRFRMDENGNLHRIEE